MAGADLAVSVNEVKLGEYKLDPASNEVVKIPLSAGDGVFKVELMVNETWTPDEFKGNGDLRKLGVAVSKIWVEVLERDYVPALTYPEIDLVGGEIVMGTSDRGVLGPGWHVLERWPMPMRWTGKKATAYIKSPDRSSHLCIDVSTTVVGSDLTIFINDNPVKTYKLVPSSNEIVKIPLSIDEGVVKVDLEVDKTWTPDGLDGKGDRRELGVAVSRIWVEKSNLTDLTAIFKSIRKDKPSP